MGETVSRTCDFWRVCSSHLKCRNHIAFGQITTAFLRETGDWRRETDVSKSSDYSSVKARGGLHIHVELGLSIRRSEDVRTIKEGLASLILTLT